MSLVGEYLRHARELRGISPLQIEIETRIRAAVIEALERGDFAQLPPEPFLRGLVRTYARYLGADSQEAQKLLVADLAAPPKPRPSAPPPLPVQSPVFPVRPPTRAPLTPLPPRQIFPPFEPPVSESSETIEETAPAMPPSPEKLRDGTFFPRNEPPSLLRDIMRLVPLPLPAILGIGALLLIILFACGWFALTQLSAAVSLATRRTPTATRIFPTVTLPIVPGAQPTAVPTFLATAPPFATFPGNPTPVRRTPTRRPVDSSSPLILDVDAIESIKIIVGVEGAQVFAGTMDPNTTRSWSAKTALYFRIENAKGAEIFFNSKQVLPAVFTERTLMERQWNVNSKNTPVSSRPTPPKPPTAIPTLTATPTPTIEKPTDVPTPTPTQTPF